MAAKETLPISLSVGVNTVVPPLMAEAGTLIDALNYEIADTVGYRRIQGYEKYDGYPNGDLGVYFRLSISGGPWVGGDILARERRDGTFASLSVILGNPSTGLYDIVPFTDNSAFIVEEDFLVQTDGESFILLQSGSGVLKLTSDDPFLTDRIVVINSAGVITDVTVSDTPNEAQNLLAVEEYLTTLRSYSTLLRGLTQNAPAPIAGLYWMDDRLYAAVNTLRLSYTVPSTDPSPPEGSRVRWNGTVYRVVKIDTTTEAPNSTHTIYLAPIKTVVTVDDNLVAVNTADTAGTVYRLDVSTTAGPTTDDTDYAVLGYFNNPATSIARGFTYLPSASMNAFNAGTYSSNLGPPLTLSGDDNPTTVYYITNADGTVLRGRLVSIVKTSGSYTTNDAVGRFQFVPIEVVAGTRDHLITSDELHTEYPTTPTSRVATISATPYYDLLAGTGLLKYHNTRYQWETYNFYGDSSAIAGYVVTGASRGAWFYPYGWGSIETGVPVELDTPKYLSLHNNSLVLGYARGSIFLSVAGEPLNYNGFDGAAEVATGDQLTGLLELPGETLGIFGKRSIRKYTDRLGAVSSKSGCFDYTALMIGQTAVYCGVNGISTLEQTAAYGDFAGQRVSSAVNNYLRPRLVVGQHSFERGGVVLAYGVRTKNQYRLVLSTGEQIFVTLTDDGPKISFCNYAQTGEIRVPFAWSSETTDSGRERIHVRWADEALNSSAFELESGWGFNGKVFRHYFVLAHLFVNNGAQYTGVEEVRLYGQGYGLTTLHIDAAGVETDFEQAFSDHEQDISIPKNLVTIFDSMRPVTNTVDHANWGLGIKLRFVGTVPENSTLTEPPHNCQALVVTLRPTGARDG